MFLVPSNFPEHGREKFRIDKTQPDSLEKHTGSQKTVEGGITMADKNGGGSKPKPAPTGNTGTRGDPKGSSKSK